MTVSNPVLRQSPPSALNSSRVFKPRHYLLLALAIILVLLFIIRTGQEFIPKPLPTPLPTPLIIPDANTWVMQTSQLHKMNLKLPPGWKIYKGSPEEYEVAWQGNNGLQLVLNVELTTQTDISQFVSDLDRKRATAFSEGTKSIEVLTSAGTIIAGKAAVERKERFLGSVDPSLDAYVINNGKAYLFQMNLNDTLNFMNQYEELFNLILANITFSN